MGIIHSDADLATAWGHGFNAPDDAANPYGPPHTDIRTPHGLLSKTQALAAIYQRQIREAKFDAYKEGYELGKSDGVSDDDMYEKNPYSHEAQAQKDRQRASLADLPPYSPPESRPSQKPAASRQADALERIADILDQFVDIFSARGK